MNENLIVIFGISFIFLMTCLGSLTVLFNKKQNDLAQNLFLGFAGGVMLAASIFSLLIPSFTYSTLINVSHVLPAVGGIIIGSIFIMIFDIIISKKNKNNYRDKKTIFSYDTS